MATAAVAMVVGRGRRGEREVASIDVRSPTVLTDELPPWSGDPARGPVAIRGRVHAAHLPASVRLALAPPDPGPWRGIEITSEVDGRFELRAPRPGRYLLEARAGALLSRAVEIDVGGTGASADVALFAHPCRRWQGRITAPRETRLFAAWASGRSPGRTSSSPAGSPRSPTTTAAPRCARRAKGMPGSRRSASRAPRGRSSGCPTIRA
jgi:hypothetical protein